MRIRPPSILLLASVVLFLIFAVCFNSRVNGNVPLQFSNDEVEVILGGDVMLGRTVMSKSLDLDDPTYPFRKVADELKEADLVFVNLESPIIEDCPRTHEGLKFCADPRMRKGLALAGIDIVSLANNHSRNYGDEGLEQTKRFLEEENILATGLGELVIKEVRGIKFGFLGFDFVSKKPKDEDFKLVENSDVEVDVLIIGVHWGGEYSQKVSSSQREWAEGLVNAGADVVVGHHPHWLQEIEYIKAKPIYYSLGNFVFDQMWSEKTREGLLIRLTFKNGEIEREERLPIYISSWAQPEFVE